MYTIIRNTFLLGFIAFAVSACSTLSKSECQTANWKNIGYGDGSQGYQASRIAQHRSACAEYKVTPDLAAYTAGRNEGLRQYCTPANGYNKGLSGYTYNGVCTNSNEREFVEALNYGLAINREQKIYSRLRNKYENQLRYIAELEDNMRYKEKELTSGWMSVEKNLRIVADMKEIRHDLEAAKSSIGGLRHDMDVQAGVLADLKGQRSYR